MAYQAMYASMNKEDGYEPIVRVRFPRKQLALKTWAQVLKVHVNIEEYRGFHEHLRWVQPGVKSLAALELYLRVQLKRRAEATGVASPVLEPAMLAPSLPDVNPDWLPYGVDHWEPIPFDA